MKTLLFSMFLAAATSVSAGVPDSVYVRPVQNNRSDGMRLEYSYDQYRWQNVSDGVILSSDFGEWGAHKKMFNPSFNKGHNGEYVIVFQLIHDGNLNQFGVASTRDGYNWKPQDYPTMKGVKQCIKPVIAPIKGGYEVRFESEGKMYKTTTTDLYHFTDPVVVSNGIKVAPIHVPYSFIHNLQAHHKLIEAIDATHREVAKDDKNRFGDMKTIDVELTVDGANSKKISDKLMGIFFEDINYSADGGLYAELVQNRDFEYTSADNGRWNATTAWKLVGEGATMSIQESNPIHQNNKHYAVLTITDPKQASLQNSGFDGIVVKKGQKYDVSAFLLQTEGKSAPVNIVLKEGDKVLGKTILTPSASSWKQLKSVIRVNDDAKNAVLCIEPTATGKLAVDFVSLFPQDTYKGRKNGLRKDLAETLEALHPRFMRFPGGCVAHGNGLENIYNWKETIGALWERKPQFNLWGYHQSKGLGYYEYFQFCEDLKMEPLPVIAAGVCCQNSGRGGHGQQGGIPMENMQQYIQDILDLIEWANGDVNTVWGKKRAEQGHPKPFNLHYIGIGNEDLISQAFAERYLMIIKAIKEKYPNIIVCGTAGPFFRGSDYDEGWRLANDNKIDMLDEHYYCPPGWYLHNQDYYDNYDRSKGKVYLGEYAAHGDGRKSTIETSLACALHYCNIERNGDVVEMTSYAPLLAKEGHTQWNPDMIYFNNHEVKPTVDYYSQLMNGKFAGDTYIDSKIKYAAREHNADVNTRLAVSTVKDSKSGKTYLKIVNLTPAQANVKLNLSNIALTAEKDCKATVLSGNYDSMTARPVDAIFRVAPQGTIQVDAYSFTVIELN